MFKITIEGPDIEKPIVLEYEQISFVEERGYNRIFSNMWPVSIMPNGQERFLLKGWTGCLEFEDFSTDGEIAVTRLS